MLLLPALQSQKLEQGAAASSPLHCPEGNQPSSNCAGFSESTCVEYKDECERPGKDFDDFHLQLRNELM